jgi:hypothetical protein
MGKGDEQREYLASALKAAGVELKEASEAIGCNAAYIQQYVGSRKTPMYLKERHREQLVRLYNLDADRLKPPELKMPARGDAAAETPSIERVGVLEEAGDIQRAQPPGASEAAHKSQELHLLRIWHNIPPHKRGLALVLLESLQEPISKVA